MNLGAIFIKLWLFVFAVIYITPAWSSSTQPNNLTQECKNFLKKLDSTDYKYEWVRSYEKPNQKSSMALEIFFYYRIHSETTPMVLYNGGPNLPSHRLLDMVSRLPDSFVMIDQRGTGCSTQYPIKTVHHMADYAYWSTTGIVHDSEIIRQHLGFKKWSIWGQSFGSFIVQRYVELFPESLIKAGSYTGVTPNIQMHKDQSLTPVFDLRYEHQVKTIVEYFKKYPSDKELVKKIIRERLCHPNDLGKFNCGVKALIRFVQDIGFVSHWPRISQEIKIISDGPKAQLESTAFFLTQKGMSFEELSEVIPSEFGSILVSYVLAPIFWRETIGEFNTLNNGYKFRRLALRSLDEDLVYLLESHWFDGGESFYRYQYDPKFRESYDKIDEEIFKTGIKPIDNKRIHQNLEKYPDLEYTVWSGEFDFYLPSEMISLAVKQMGSRVRYISVKGIGHDYGTPEVGRFISPWYAQQNP